MDLNSKPTNIYDDNTVPEEDYDIKQKAKESQKVIQEHFNHIRSAVRLCPITAEELEANAQNIIEIVEKNKLIAYHPESREGLLYNFDYCFDQGTAQNVIFESVGIPSVNSILEGFNSAIISYGPSKTGKTELLYGNEEEEGLVAQCLKEAFTYFANAPDNIGYTVIFSFWEMNNDSILDLLNPDKNVNHKVRRHEKYGVYVTNLYEVEVRSWDELEELIESGTIISQKAAAQRGTRWHSFLKLTLIREDLSHPELTLKSSFMFVNLKGSDRIGQMGARGELLKEGASINKSLTAFGNAIHNIVEYSRKRLNRVSKKNMDKAKKDLQKEIFSMFGDSKVTSLLSEALGGNYATTIICSVSPTEYHYLETMDSLENLRIASHIPALPQRGDVDTIASKLHKKIVGMRRHLPVDTLAEGHPPTEEQENLQKLESEFELRSKGITPRDDNLMDSRKEPAPMALTEDAEQRVWKKNDVKANKHGSRHTFYFPKGTNKNTTYKGQWEGNAQSGEGTMETPKFKYTGGWKNGKKEGFGIFWKKVLINKEQMTKKRSLTSTTKDSDKKVKGKYRYVRKYKGEYKGDKKEGQGIFYYRDGSIYEGEWKNNLRCGNGQLYLTDGSKYDGEWDEGKQAGFGIFYYKNGDRFEGYFKDGMKHGPGVFIYTEKGRKYKGEWYEDTAKCGELSDIEYDEADAEVEEATGESILIPNIELADTQGVLEKMVNHLRAKDRFDDIDEAGDESQSEYQEDDVSETSYNDDRGEQLRPLSQYSLV
mmetsp:Transcript_8699/g.12861  ORF Transcript_8699/g.12861 Transcript_8699/m.12861 type:complete len:767 (+) Transcript_8699:134-2434(+)|eukprot:CAMPEP_0117421530 /NCGR_PEP_ID=MMETSP0758-20121206/2588_1 /TAXON_ID=63605 /ORGANISM="Percolomonas cosmopolitus, Strain AE-1 (ATCC 50343)" /LENGTH=766 /DNA_ID=CAMNT_0005203679 /DNA_START=11 /DNA_END=2311 /DNA_ORIENTATION=-